MLQQQPSISYDEFNQSVVVLDKVQLKSLSVINLLHHPKNKQINFGPLKQYLLTNFIDSDQEGRVIPILTIDNDSNYIEINQQCEQLLKQHSSYDVILIGINGLKQTGKSFFLDKLLNLTGVQSNTFTKITNSGLYIWSIPFVKEGLRIFIVDIFCQKIPSQQFSILSAIMALICSKIIFIGNYNDHHEKVGNIFHEEIKKVLKRAFYKNNEINKYTQVNCIAEQLIYLRCLQEDHKSQYFQNIINYQLPNARNPTYTGNNEDLKSVSFFAKQIVNQNYLIAVSALFKKIYSSCYQKKFNGLIQNGNILFKYVKHISAGINKKAQLHLEKIYNEIFRQLYISAYNFCVISYHEQLEKAFEDQTPKDIDQILLIFQFASENVFKRYNQYTLDLNLHLQFEQKLLHHIDERQQMILDVNNKKAYIQTQQILKKHSLSDYQNFKRNAKIANCQGSNNILTLQMIKMMKNLKDGPDLQRIRRIDELSKQKQNLKNEWNKVSKELQQSDQNKKLLQKQEQQLEKLQKKYQQKKKQLQQMRQRGDKQTQIKRLNDLSLEYQNKYRIDAESIVKVKQQLQVNKAKSNKTNQLIEDQIKKIIQQQNIIKDEIKKLALPQNKDNKNKQSKLEQSKVPKQKQKNVEDKSKIPKQQAKNQPVKQSKISKQQQGRQPSEIKNQKQSK